MRKSQPVSQEKPASTDYYLQLSVTGLREWFRPGGRSRALLVGHWDVGAFNVEVRLGMINRQLAADSNGRRKPNIPFSHAHMASKPTSRVPARQ